jgi:hypothetical protein
MQRLTLLDAMRGTLCLARIALQSRGRIRSRYWQWRDETAFGNGRWPVSRAQRVRALIEYGAWVWRMRALTRG